jgi:hypothetical protein
MLRQQPLGIYCLPSGAMENHLKRFSLLGTITAVIFASVPATPILANVLSEKDGTTFRDCKMMNADEAFRNQSCRAVMRKVHVTKSDLVKMKSCESQTSQTVNPDCAAMAAKHPDLAHGHGMDDSH